MKKVVFLLFVLLPFFGNCQDKWKTIDYNGVSVQIPFEWGSKNTINLTNLNYGYTDIPEYMISCWSKKETNNTLAIQWIEAEIDNDLRIKADIKWKQERFPMYEQLQFNEIVDIDFLGFKAKKCRFHGNYMGYIEGEYIAFTKNEYSYIVLIGGDKIFYQSDDYNHILNSLKPFFLGIVQQKESNTKVITVDENFTRYEFRNYNLSIPNTMELRDENSFVSLSKEIIKDRVQNIKKVDIGDFNFVFQPVGMDDIQNSTEMKKALDLYSRVLISYQKNNKEAFFKWNETVKYTQEEYNQLNKSFKNDLLKEAEQLRQMGIAVEFVKIDNIQIAKNANKFVYIKHQYIRKGLHGDVKVIDYYISNSNEMVKLTISHRVSESNLWESDFSKIIDTFSFTTKR